MTREIKRKLSQGLGVAGTTQEECSSNCLIINGDAVANESEEAFELLGHCMRLVRVANESFSSSKGSWGTVNGQNVLGPLGSDQGVC